jgi:zinc protease
MTKGTTTRSATQIARSKASADRSPAAPPMTARRSMTVPSAQIGTAMTILADVATHPAFAADEIERARTQSIDGLNVAMKNPAQLSAMVADRWCTARAPMASPCRARPPRSRR